MHPRSKHAGRYDIAALVAASPELAAFMRPNPKGDRTIDFADPEAVKALNRALLILHYGVWMWDVPPGYLTPPVPGRADYIHYLADLVEGRGEDTRILDIGVGANCIYPIIGRAEYGWTFVGSDVDEIALRNARAIVDSNTLTGIMLRKQASPRKVLEGVVKPGERFAACMSNPPFHASEEEARAGTERKLRNLGHAPGKRNFGGGASELWCEGGEFGFASRLVEESLRMKDACGWFTTLLSKESSVAGLKKKLGSAAEVRVIPMGQGQKTSRILAWRYA